MKVALLLSGQFRNGKECYQSIYDNLISHYDTDVFISYYYEEPDVTFEELDELYKPKYIMYEKYEKDLIDKFNLTNNFLHYTESNPSSLCKMWFGNMMVNILKDDYEKNNDMKYDVVIKCRFDVNILEKIELKLPNNQIYIPIGWDHMDGVNDVFAYGDSDSMNHYLNAYYSLDGFIHEGRFIHPEMLLKAHLMRGNMMVLRNSIKMSLRGMKIHEQEYKMKL
jgi:hypothetical protein